MMKNMFSLLPKASRLRRKVYDTFWNHAISELERRLRFPNKTLKWTEDDLSKDLKKVAKENFTVVLQTPPRQSEKTVNIDRESRKKVSEEKGFHMKLRPRKRGKVVKQRIAALDPGVRTFQTLYDTDNNVIEFGVGDIYKMKLDKRGLKTTVKNIHSRLAKYLCDKYGLILIPRLEIANSSDPYLAAWDHPGFVDRLFVQARRPGSTCRVVEVEEAWTSKTCSGCGKVGNPGRSKVFKCVKCGLVIDRDINGARNILLKNMNALKIGIE